jgi:hypothetical protein
MEQASTRDWLAWHHAYDDPSSPLSRRLLIVQQQLRTALDRCPPGGIRIVSVCAGQGRDVIGVLPGHARRADVTARLVELDRRNVELARAAAVAAGLSGIDVVHADASTTAAYLGAVPADVLLVCGVFGNISTADVEHTVAHLPGLAARDATVIWTRHRRPPDLTPWIREQFRSRGFEEVAFLGEDRFGVGAHRWPRPAQPHCSPARLFTFFESDVVEVANPSER